MKIEITYSAGTSLEEGKDYELIYDNVHCTWIIQKYEDGELNATWVNDMIHDGIEFKLKQGLKNEIN